MFRLFLEDTEKSYNIPKSFGRFQSVKLGGSPWAEGHMGPPRPRPVTPKGNFRFGRGGKGRHASFIKGGEGLAKAKP
jgi:hypothetical protein